MIDRLKKSFDIANGACIYVLKFFRWIGIGLVKWAWILCPTILIEPLSFFAIPIIAWWGVFWVSFFWGDVIWI